MKDIIKISLLAPFLLNGLISTAQVLSPEVRSKMLVRASELELKTAYKAPPGDALSHNTAGYAKIMCSAVFITGLTPEFAAENVGYFTAPYSERAKVGKPIIDYEKKSVSITLPNGITRTAIYTGDQGCVCLPEGKNSLYFKPIKISRTLPDAATTLWPMGDVLPTTDMPANIDMNKVKKAIDSAFAPEQALTAAFVVTYKGRIIGERYANGITQNTALESWSMGKSLSATQMGILIRQGVYTLEQPAPIPQWQSKGDGRAKIRIMDIMHMSSGLYCRAPQDPDYDASLGYPDHLYLYTGGINSFEYAASLPQQWLPNTVGRYRNCDPVLTNYLNRLGIESTGKNYYTFLKTWQPTINSLQCDQYRNAALIGSWYAGLRNNGTCRLANVVLSNKQQVMFRYKSKYNGGKWFIYLDSLNGQLLKTVPLTITKDDWKIATTELPSIEGKHSLYFKYYSPAIKTSLETGVLFEWFQFGENFPGKGKPGFDSAYKHFNELMQAKTDATPVMFENNTEQFRTSHVFERGNWLVKGNVVKPDVPHSMNAMPANAPKNRLGLAMWLTDNKNPLVTRTMVNRLWEQLFGFGLVETLEDLGTQGIAPTHKELLDHLSWQFMNEFNWSIKKLLKEMVLSATYRQQSKVNDELLQKDPNNKMYARGPRVRLSAEQLRDQALEVSKLLSKKMYGQSVMPFQPDGIWRSPYNGDTWKLSKGEDEFRRALYTYWKRTAPYPSMITFDGGAREVCITRRIRTNTPLQALTSLNDSSYLVMARYFAYHMQEPGGTNINQQIAKGYEAMMYKPINSPRLNALLDLYNTSLSKFKKNENNSCEMIGVIDKHNNPETAALVVVANAMLNLDEWLNKN